MFAVLVSVYGFKNNNVIRMGVKATTDVATNGSFASGTTGWLQFGLPTQAAMISNVTGGVFQFQRNGTQAVVFQETGLPVAMAEDPLSTVVLGAGKMLSNFELLRKISLD